MKIRVVGVEMFISCGLTHTHREKRKDRHDEFAILRKRLKSVVRSVEIEERDQQQG